MNLFNYDAPVKLNPSGGRAGRKRFPLQNLPNHRKWRRKVSPGPGAESRCLSQAIVFRRLFVLFCSPRAGGGAASNNRSCVFPRVLCPLTCPPPLPGSTTFHAKGHRLNRHSLFVFVLRSQGLRMRGSRKKNEKGKRGGGINLHDARPS